VKFKQRRYDMGFRRRRYEAPEIPIYYRQLQEFQKTPSVDISPFIQFLEQKKQSQIEQLTTERVGRLRDAIMSAIGSLSYNPYEKRLTQSIYQTVSRPYETMKTPYTEAASKMAPSLKTAGAYIAYPQAPYAAIYKPTYESAFETTRQFLTSTKEALTNLGFTPEEAYSAMSPYISAIKEGLQSSILMGGKISPEYETFVQEWGLI